MWKPLLIGAAAGAGAYAFAGKIASKFTGPETTSGDAIKNTVIVYGSAGLVGAVVTFAAMKAMRVA
jgi:hypothetical protein